MRTWQPFDLLVDDGKRDRAGLRELTVRLLDSPVGGHDAVGRKLSLERARGLNELLGRLTNRDIDQRGVIDLGETLADLLLPAAIRELLAQSLSALTPTEGLRLGLRLDPDLADMPWEYTWVARQRGQRDATGFMALDPRVSIVRRETVQGRVSIDRGPRDRRVVAVLADPDDPYTQRLDLALERRNLRTALHDVPGIAVDVRMNATIDDLSEALAKDADIVHFAGHGEADRLYLVDRDDQPWPLPAEQLALNVRNRGVQLVVMGACESGTRDRAERWSGVATRLIAGGVPAVIAMQYAVNDKMAIAFSKRLYQALTAGWSLDEAVSAGRLGMYNYATGGYGAAKRASIWPDWGVPVLYARPEAPVSLASVKEARVRKELEKELLAAVNVRLGSIGETGRVNVTSDGGDIDVDVKRDVGGTLDVRYRTGTGSGSGRDERRPEAATVRQRAVRRRPKLDATTTTNIPAAIADKAAEFAGRGWVAQDVADWVADGSERFFAITGAPGTGKTALAAWLAGAGPAPRGGRDAASLRRLRSCWTAMHFCVRGQGGTIDGGAFASSLAAQLAGRLRDFLPAVAEANGTTLIAPITVGGSITGEVIQQLIIEAGGRSESAAAVTALWQGAVRKPLQALAKSQPGLRAFVLVDALDEAQRVSAPNIVSLLRDSDDFPAGVRFLVTMSNELDARELFPGARVIDLSDAATEGAANDDIRAYVRAQLAPSQAAEDRLVTAAAGNFLYIHFLVDEIRRNARSLDDIDELPAGLNPLYSAYLDRVTGTVPGQTPSPKWSQELQPLVGCISVATPSAPGDLLPNWLGRDAGQVSQMLTDARQLTEDDDSPDGFGYRLYHRSMGDYLAARRFGTNGRTTNNRYHTPPETQHLRIATHYMDNYASDWHLADSYGLRHVAGHLAAAAAAEVLPAMRRGRRDALYGLVLDPVFQAAQKDLLGSLHPTLADLRQSIETALANDDVVPLLQCVAGFRDLARSGAIAQGIFEAAAGGDFETAIRDAEHYGPPPRPRGRWARVLNAWIAWQAARNNKPKAACQAAEGVVGRWSTAGAEAEPLYWELCRALIVRAAKALLGRGTDPGDFLRAFPQEYETLAADVAKRPEQPASDAETADLRTALSSQLRDFEHLLRTAPYEAVETPFLNAETQTWAAMSLRDVLLRVAARPEGKTGIERTLGPVLGNPYARYRDIALVALGTVVVAVPDDDWADEKLRAILLAGLDAEGVTFTFDLPTLVLAELRRRGGGHAELGRYLEQAHAGGPENERWVTDMHALNADALSKAWLGDQGEAMATLLEASRRPPGFAGYTSAAYLALANRCVELGLQDVPYHDVWGPNGDRPLVDMAREQAGRILDQDFREERNELVDRYAGWLDEPQPDIRAIHDFIGVTPDPDSRRTYKDLAAARWVAANTPETRAWLKALVPMVLEDTTTLDAMLGRVIGPLLLTLSNADLDAVAELVATRLTTGRPWEMGVPLQRPVAW